MPVGSGLRQGGYGHLLVGIGDLKRRVMKNQGMNEAEKKMAKEMEKLSPGDRLKMSEQARGIESPYVLVDKTAYERVCKIVLGRIGR